MQYYWEIGNHEQLTYNTGTNGKGTLKEMKAAWNEWRKSHTDEDVFLQAWEENKKDSKADIFWEDFNPGSK